MTKFILSCCSTVDLSPSKLKKRNISWTAFSYFLDDKEMKDDMFQTLSSKEFYQKMADGASTKTSQINAEGYYNYFEPFAKQNQAVVHLCLSSGLSGSFNSAKIAVSELKEKYPNFEIYLVDSLCASGGFGLLVDLVADKRDQGFTAKQAYEYAEEIKLNIHLDFYSTDLTFYVRGGRISKASGFFGSILKICPVMDMNSEGKLIVRHKARGRAMARERVLSTMVENCINGKDYDGKCFICHSDCEDEAKRLTALIESNFDNLQGQIEVYSIGPTIGSHSGPGTVALFYVGSKRTI